MCIIVYSPRQFLKTCSFPTRRLEIATIVLNVPIIVLNEIDHNEMFYCSQCPYHCSQLNVLFKNLPNKPEYDCLDAQCNHTR